MIVLGLFFGSFSVVYGTFGIVGDLIPGWLSWGYPFGLMALALIVFAMLSYERARGRGRVVWAPGLLGALASALHPWQGELLIVILVLAELIRWREHLRGRNLALPVLTIALTGLPLVYYVALGHLDLSWSLARIASKHTFSFWSIAIGISPLAIVAILGYRGKPRDFLELMTRIWPLAAVVIYILSATGAQRHPAACVQRDHVPVRGAGRDRRQPPELASGCHARGWWRSWCWPRPRFPSTRTRSRSPTRYTRADGGQRQLHHARRARRARVPQA